MSFSQTLPLPQHTYTAESEINVENAVDSITNYLHTASKAKPPRYGSRDCWLPRNDDDFEDGGAYPEVPCVQFPYGVGKYNRDKDSNALPVFLGEDGKVRYDTLLRQDASTADRVIHCKYTDLVPSVLKDRDETLEKPTEEEIEEITEKTREALEKQVCSKIYAALPAKAHPKRNAAKYVRYTPTQQGEDFNSGAKQRVIRMVEMPRDPMSPPRFKINNKIPAAPPSPPAPVLHSPPRKVSVKDQLEWKIPPCISNWKNPKGYTIPLDKRLASDGRGLQDPHINDNFAKFSEALYIAERKAREAVEMRSQLKKAIAQKEKEQKEANLVRLAQEAREERKGLKKKEYESVEEMERDNLRMERHRDRDRARRIAKAGNKRAGHEREKERDVSEKIALGMPAVKPSDDSLFDQRLFNQSRGLDSGFAGGEDEVYNVFDKPWNRRADLAGNLYRPGKNVDNEMYGEEVEEIIKTSRFMPEKSFAGVDATPSGERRGPVQFEKKVALEEDPFELDKFLLEAKKGKKTDRDRDSPRDEKRHRK